MGGRRRDFSQERDLGLDQEDLFQFNVSLFCKDRMRLPRRVIIHPYH